MNVDLLLDWLDLRDDCDNDEVIATYTSLTKAERREVWEAQGTILEIYRSLAESGQIVVVRGDGGDMLR